MKLPDLRNFDLNGKRVLVRVDFDVPLRLAGARSLQQNSGQAGQALRVADTTRIESSLPTIKYLLLVGAKIILLSHLGRPEGKIVSDLSLGPVVETLRELMPQISIKFPIKIPPDNEIGVLENLRFNAGEETNDLAFARQLAGLGDFYINEAFAVCHREHASIVALSQLLPHAAGLSLLKEVEVLSGVLENPQRPLVVILGGAKEEKLLAVTGLLKFADQILIGGKLPTLMENGEWRMENGEKIVVGELNEGGKDITLETAEKFTTIIKTAGTIVWSGPMGEWEVGNGRWEIGTRRIAEAVIGSGAFTVIGGGDTEAALTKLGLAQKINFVSSGGGAMLEFLAHGDLVGLKTLRV